MKGITGFRLRVAKDTANASKSDIPRIEPHLDAEALESLKLKITELGDGLLSMNDGEFNEWIDALPRDEFFEWIALGAEEIAAIIRASRRRAA
jgi:hypothetical protein